MRFYQTLLSGAALVAAALAVEINEYPSEVQPGRSYTITYTPGDETATFILRQGDPNDLDTLGEIGTGTGGTFTWEVDDSLPNGQDYALEIRQGDETNYSGLIALSGSTAPSASSSGSASASATPSSSASESMSMTMSMSTTASMSMTTGASASASAGVSSSVGANSTITTATLSSTRTASASDSDSTGTATGSSGVPESTGAASAIGSSPLALIFGAVAAMAYLN